jgi:hypothetical protein
MLFFDVSSLYLQTVLVGGFTVPTPGPFESGGKKEKKMFVCCHREKKRNSGVNFTNILSAAFATLYLRQKSTNLKCKYKKAASETTIRKSRA